MIRRSLRYILLLVALGGANFLRAQTRGDTDTQSLALPPVGDLSLRVIAPDLLELTRISTGDDPWCVGGGLLSPSTAFSGLRVQAGSRQLEIVAAGWKRRPLYADFHHPDLRVANCLYLRVQRAAHEPGFWKPPVEPGENVFVVDVAGALLPRGRPIHVEADDGRLSPALHVNQEGYVPSLPKQAMVGYYLGDLGELNVAPDSAFAVVDARTYTPVYQGRLRPRPERGYADNPPYQRVLEADFTALRTPGEYRLFVPGLGVSYPFLIDDGIAMGFLRTYALGLYEQRCGAANALPFTRFTHDACHIAPAAVPSPDSDPRFAFTWKTIAGYAADRSNAESVQPAPPLTSEAAALYPFVRKGAIDVAGGHHDAGDYSKYTENSAQLLHYLVFAADAFPLAGGGDNLGIPESGDGVPDIAEEAKWEADFLVKLQDDDGGFYFLVYPRDREYEYDVLPDHGDPQVVWPKNTAVTAAAVAALAECGSSPVLRRHDPHACDRYLAAARKGWAFLQTAIARHGRDGAYQKITFYGDRWGHNDELAWAAAALFAATGDPAYERALFDAFPDPADSNTFRWGWWRLSEGWGNAIRTYAFAVRSGRLPAGALDRRYLAACEDQIIAAADETVARTADSAYAVPFENQTKAVRGGGYHFALDQASDVAVASLILPKPDYVAALIGAMNYEGGCNPVNRPFVTGLGVPRQRELVSQYAENARRLLPPSGIPIGYIQPGFDYTPMYRTTLRDLCYPSDGAAVQPYPLQDRWTDVHNVNTEYIAVNQARALLSCACLARLAPAQPKAWRAVAGSIQGAPAQAGLGKVLPLRLAQPADLPPLARARIVWEARGQQPAFGAQFAFTPQRPGAQWVEAEAEWPDGRRVFAAAAFTADSPSLIWFKGQDFPEGALPSRNNQGDLHENGFTQSPEALTVGPGDTLYAWVRLDPAHPPRELMLAWKTDDGWEHRAYWGRNQITYGRNGSAGRRSMGPLPAAGQWARLSVKAEAVDLAGKTPTGMSFSLLGGGADFGAVGRER